MYKMMEIREARESDISNIATLGKCVWVDTYATTGVFDKISDFVETEFTKDNISDKVFNKTVLVCVENECLLGYMVIGNTKNKRTEIETLYVLPKFQRKGIGEALLSRVLIDRSTHFWLSTWELNSKAIDFYIKQGFEETGETFFDLYGDKIRNIILEISTVKRANQGPKAPFDGVSGRLLTLQYF